VSLIFLSPFLGYSVAALLNNSVHMNVGQRGIAILAPGCRLVTYIIFSLHPPYPALVVAFAVTGFGNGMISTPRCGYLQLLTAVAKGLEDAAWSSWLGHMVNANRLQGLLHSCYSLGATLGPTIATSMIVKVGLPWYTYYYMMV
jgi:fucose permease